MVKLIIFVFFVLAVIVFTIIKYAAKGIKAGYDHVHERDRRTGGSVLPRHLTSSNAPLEQHQPERTFAGKRRSEWLERFKARQGQYGQGFAPSDEFGADARVCGLAAGLFAKLVNGKALTPSRSYSSHDLAVAWVGVIATDIAAQATGANFEFAGLAMPISLISLDGLNGANAEGVGDDIAGLGATAFDLHNRLVASGEAGETATLIAKSFMEWAVDGGDAGLFALRRLLPRIAVHIEATNAAA